MSDNIENSVIFRKIPLTVNCGILKSVYPEKTYEVIQTREELPHICFGETVIFCFTFLDDELQPMQFQNNDIFELAADADFIHGDDPLMLFSGPEMVNIPGDWDDADPTQGKVSIRVNCNTAGFEQKIGNDEKIVIRLEARRIFGEFQTVLFCDRAVAQNAVHTNENAPEAAGPEYYTAPQVDQIMEMMKEEINENNALQDQTIAENTEAVATAQSCAEAAQSCAETAQSCAETAQQTADSKITKPETGTAGQVLTLDADGSTAVWATPAGGSGTWSADDLQERTIGTEYTADVDGWLILYVEGASSGTCIPILINGVTVSVVGNYSSNAGYPFGTMLPLYAGQTYKVDYSGYMGSWNVNYYFAPCGRA